MAERKCLKCDKLFESLSRGNRICPRCKQLKEVPSESGVVDANKRLKKVLKEKHVKFPSWRGNAF